jgi:signal peptidase II
MTDVTPDVTPVAPLEAAAAGDPSVSRRHWLVFAGLALLIVVADQASKLWVDAGFPNAWSHQALPGLAAPTPILGDFLRIAKSYNSGGLFGLFNAGAPILAVASIVVIGLLVYVEGRNIAGRMEGGSMLTTLAFGFLLGGALGNLIDRIRVGFVIDWADMGIGDLRWYTFNVADAAISLSIVTLLLAAFLQSRPAPAEAGR